MRFRDSVHGLRRRNGLTMQAGSVLHAAASDLFTRWALPFSVCLALSFAGLAAQDSPARWTIAPHPDLLVGAGSDPETLFQSIDAVATLSDGRIVVADPGLLEVRVLGANGQILARMGRAGRGPGEFERIFGMWVTSDDQIGVWDPGNQRITVFSPDGETISSSRLRDGPPNGSPEAFIGSTLNDEVILATLGRGGRGRGTGMAPNPWLLTKYALDGEFLQQIGHVQGMWRIDVNPFPYTPVPWVVLRQDSLVASDGFEPTLEVRDAAGQRVRTIDVGEEQRGSRADWSALQDSLSRQEDARPTAAFFIELLETETVPFDPRLPAHAGLLTDGDLLWVREYDRARDAIWLREIPTTPRPGGSWIVTDSDGNPVATVAVPESFIPMQVLGEHMLGVDVDEWGAHRFARYRLER